MVAVPACKKPVDPAPHMKKGIPSPDASGVSFFPLMVLEFDKEIDGFHDQQQHRDLDHGRVRRPQREVGRKLVFHHLVNSFQIVVENTQTFVASTEYAVVVFNGLLSSKGDPINGGMALRFTVASSGNQFKPSFSAPAQNVGAGAAGEIVLTWTQAQENALDDLRRLRILRGDDDRGRGLSSTIPRSSRATNITGDTIPVSKGMVTGDTHYFRVICRDSQGNIRVTSQLSAVVK